MRNKLAPELWIVSPAVVYLLPAGNCRFEEVGQERKRPNVYMVNVSLSEKKKCLSRHWAVMNR
jgi:hypothetical protein